MSVLTEPINPLPNPNIDTQDNGYTAVNQTKQFSPLNFSKWRPSFHLLAPSNWLNDPCGPGYDPSTGQYHLAFQWNPKNNHWGNISWGHSTSYDLISWKTSSHPCLVPSAPYDCKGIFTGCFQPTNLHGQQDGTLTYFYTSVNKLPIHYTLPYSTGSESLSVALSHDAGRTWKRYSHNPILPGPPAGLDVTGWRDPYTFSWSCAPETFRREHTGKEVLYGLISGGLVNHTPTVFVYTIDKTALTEWKYIGTLLDVELNLRPSRWSGDFGVNWEVTNLVTLADDDGVSRDFIIMGSEGCLKDDQQSRNKQPSVRNYRIPRSQLWMCIKENQDTSSSSALMQYGFGGIFDNGLFYAANSFWDPVTQQQVLFGWITEEDLPDGPRSRQGWSGLISLPRVLKLQTIHRVTRARSTMNLRDITSIEAEPDSYGTYTIRTLGVSLDPRTNMLRNGARKSAIGDTILSSPFKSLSTLDINTCQSFVPLCTTRWEVDAEIAVGKDSGRVGFVIFHDTDKLCKTVLFWNPVSETFQIERPHLHDCDTPINHATEIAPHTLFTINKPNQIKFNNDKTAGLASDVSSWGTETEETLRIHAVFDVSVLEILVNERTTLSTRIYHTSKKSSKPACVGLYFFAERLGDQKECDHGTATRLLHATVWDGLTS
ncbi:glycosyl hydrolase [Talaromyces proteolyticus]|uniref:Glycosyl hydrolase n=1 Tax=Talaromyces proteolyticus TaxID=1131652 RepID=A0AAD4L0K4_9EURO|nr:glycosyl hydrolase [Talaromyces proteolyticus]KAH8705317.1 glycosyl hydrolase [Talaromyces proteolyticus]